MSDYEIERISRALRELNEEISDFQYDVASLKQENKNLRAELNGEREDSHEMYIALIEKRDIKIIETDDGPAMFYIQPLSPDDGAES